MRKGAWLNRPVIIRESRKTNRHDVDVEKAKQLGNALEIAVKLSSFTDRDSILFGIRQI